jgi:hypothetical protein
VNRKQSTAKRFGYTVLFPLAIWKKNIAHMLAAILWANKNAKTAKISSPPKVAVRNP